MSLEQNMERLAAAIEKLAVALEASASASAPVETKVKPVKTKPEKAVVVVVETPKDEFSGEPTVTVTEVLTTAEEVLETFDYDTLKAAILKLASKGKDGKEKAIALLAEYGQKTAKDVPADKWPELYGKVLAVL